MDRFPRERLVRTGDRRDIGRIFAFVKAYQATYPIAMMCRLLDVSTSGYHAWRHQRPSRRAVDDAALTARIAEIHKASDGTYGSPRIHAELRDEGTRVGRKRVARLMRLAALAGVSRRRRPKTTVRDEEARPAPDLVERNFHVEAMDELWVALAKGLRGAAGATVLSHTYVPTATGFLYLAVVLDAFSRRVVGWAMETHLRAALVLQALDMAVKRRRPKGVIHHSDQGSQYTALDFGARRGKAGIRPSMGSVGDAYDNAMAESFFATLECELIDRRRFENPDHARREVFQFIEGWYNPRRRHSAIGYKSPINYERSIPPVAPIFDSPRKRGNSNFRFFRDHWNLPVSDFMMRPYQCRDRDGAHARRYAGASPVGISLGNRAVAYPSRSRDHVGQSPNRLWASNHGVRSPALGMQSSNGPSTGIPRSTADPGHQNSHPGRQRQF